MSRSIKFFLVWILACVALVLFLSFFGSIGQWEFLLALAMTGGLAWLLTKPRTAR